MQYHVGLARGDVAPSILLVGDRARAELVRERFDAPRPRIGKGAREYWTYTGRVRGRPTSVIATGMGCDNTEIALVELLACVDRPDLVRVGSCGALQPDARLGDLIISSGALRLEATTLGFVDAEYPAVAHHEMTLALLTAAARAGHRHRLGLTATAAGFYGWQARRGGPFAPRVPDLDARLAAWGVENFEMEASALFVLASLKKLRAGCVCAVFAERPRDRFIAGRDKRAAEERAIDVGLGALEVLADMDAKRGRAPHFTL
ncbi:MAG TPA: nucleoside phosphorylase [Planctomycetota bacterium]|nr:nucleoside phosphorylase [Planctomycetota bacterium]